MKNKNNILSLVALIVIVGAVFAIYKFGGTGSASAQIKSVVISHGIDSQGNPVGVATVFDRTKDKTVYAVLTLANATKQTKVAYTRFYNGKYVDSKVSMPGKTGAFKFFFNFEKGVGLYPAGNYKVVTYVDGKRSLETAFAFK